MEERPLSEIRETYSQFRIIRPHAEAAMERSLQTYGQMSPVVCLTTADGIELVDGFKRLRASRRLKLPSIKMVFLESTVRACKASMIQLNRVARSISDLEEAMILQSLHKTDGLPQVEIATLLGHDKSWVSRRISLIERLSDEVQEHLKLGLISGSVGRELTRLPRGNQNEVMLAVLKNKLGKREAEKLVRILLPRPFREYSPLLSNVLETISSDRFAPAATVASFSRQLAELSRLQKTVSEGANVVYRENGKPSASLLTLAITSAREVVERLERVLSQKPLEKSL